MKSVGTVLYIATKDNLLKWHDEGDKVDQVKEFGISSM